MLHDDDWVQHWLNQKTWGFRLYRCTFGDDEGWKKCLELLGQSLSEGLSTSGCNAEQRRKWRLDVVDDKQFDNADWINLRNHFLQWANSDAINDELTQEELERRADRGHLNQLANKTTRYGDAPRYTHFLYIDEESMTSIIQGDEKGLWDSEFVTVIDTWEQSELFPRSLEEDKEGRNDLKYDHGYSMRIPPRSIPGFYVSMIRAGVWHDHLYTWPPEIHRD
jgi:hypothetical protein